MSQSSLMYKFLAPLATGVRGNSYSAQNLGANRFLVLSVSSSGANTLRLNFDSVAKTVLVDVDRNGHLQTYDLSCQAVVQP